jgi:hypothetical protein
MNYEEDETEMFSLIQSGSVSLSDTYNLLLFKSRINSLLTEVFIIFSSFLTTEEPPVLDLTFF